MKKTFKKIFFASLAAVTAFTCMAVSAEEAAEKKQVKVLCLGNSILNHGANADLGWYGNWGMAASAADKDYYSILKGMVAEAYPELDVEFARIGFAALERAVDTTVDKDYTSDIDSGVSNTVKKLGAPDIVTVQLGENVREMTPESYANALVQLYEYFKALNPEVEMIYCKTFWPNAAKAKSVDIASEKVNTVFADLGVLDTVENKATGLFEHSGVANHPGDKGMQGIAELLFVQMKPALNKAVDEKAVSVSLGHSYIDFDVPAQIINDRTMVPLRAIFEALGASVEWDDATKTASSKREDVTVSIKIGENKLIKNGEEIELDVPAQIVDGRTMVPARAVSEAYDCIVEWNADKRRVELTSNFIKPAEGFVKELPPYTADDNNAIGFYTETSKQDLTVESDPDDESNKVLKITATSQDKFWTYIWFKKFQFQAGVTYKFSADVRPLSDAAGNEHEKYTTGLCFHFNGVDKGILPSDKTVVLPDQWNHVETEFTMPEDFTFVEGDDRFGVYMNPINDKGISFMADNISVTIVE